MSTNVENAAEALDRLAREEGGRQALAEVAERLSRLFGGHAFTAQVVQPKPVEAPALAQTEFDVLLASVGLQGHEKIEVIKAVREVTGLGLKEAKDFVEKVGERVVKNQTDAETAKKIKERLEKAGATVVIR